MTRRKIRKYRKGSKVFFLEQCINFSWKLGTYCYGLAEIKDFDRDKDGTRWVLLLTYPLGIEEWVQMKNVFGTKQDALKERDKREAKLLDCGEEKNWGKMAEIRLAAGQKYG